MRLTRRENASDAHHSRLAVNGARRHIDDGVCSLANAHSTLKQKTVLDLFAISHCACAALPLALCLTLSLAWQAIATPI